MVKTPLVDKGVEHFYIAQHSLKKHLFNPAKQPYNSSTVYMSWKSPKSLWLLPLFVDVIYEWPQGGQQSDHRKTDES